MKLKFYHLDYRMLQKINVFLNIDMIDIALKFSIVNKILHSESLLAY